MPVLIPKFVSAGQALSDHDLDFEVIEPGILRVVITTDSLAPLGDGALVHIDLVVAIDAMNGDYPLLIGNVVLSDAQGEEVSLAALEDGLVQVRGENVRNVPTLSPPGYLLLIALFMGLGWVFLRNGPQGVVLSLALGTVLFASTIRAVTPPGDANDDGVVDALDIPVIVAQILERSDAPGDPDCNQDGQVDVLDTVCVVEFTNHPPTLDAIADGIAEPDVLFEVTATADDPDLPDDELTFSLDAAPVGMTIDPDSGLISWTPSNAQVGGHPVTVRVTDDGGLFDTTAFNVEVETDPNQPPTIDPIANAMTEADILFQVTATADDPDLPDDEVTFSLDAAPTGRSLDPAGGLISWTPTGSQVGNHPVTVRVTDEDGPFATTSFNVKVEGPNQPPTLDPIVNAMAQQDVLFQVTASADDPDLPDDVLTFSLDAGPAGMSIDPVSGLISWTPTGGQLGGHPVTVRVTDTEGLFATTSFTVTVTEIIVNSAPDLQAPGNRIIAPDVNFQTNLFATDPDVGDTLTFSLPTAPAGMAVDPVSGVLTWSPGIGDLGTHPVTARVMDAEGLMDDENFSIEVAQLIVQQDTNNPPSLTVPGNQEIVFGNPLTGVTASATDPDSGDVLTFSLANAPAGMNIDSGSGAISWTPLEAQVGAHDVTVKVTDLAGAAALGAFVVRVLDINRAPVAVDDVYEARFGVPLSVPADGVLGNDSDPTGDAITAVLQSDAGKGLLALNSDGSFDYLLEPPDPTTAVTLEIHCDNTRNPGSLGSDSAVDSEYQGNSTLAVGDVDDDGDLEIVGVWYVEGSGGRGDVWFMNARDCTDQFHTGANIEEAGGFDVNGHLGLYDIDGDGDLEILGPRGHYPDDDVDNPGAIDNEHLIAIHHNGTLVWPGDGGSETSTTFSTYVSQNSYDDQGPTFVDLEGDGTTEIVMASSIGSNNGVQSFVVVYNAADGTIKWEYLATVEQSGANQPRMPYVVDLDLDGTMEVIVHNSVIDHTGVLEFVLPSLVTDVLPAKVT